MEMEFKMQMIRQLADFLPLNLLDRLLSFIYNSFNMPSPVPRSSYLKVASAVLTNLGSGLLLLPFTVTNILVLTVSITLGIVCIGLSIKIEDLLTEL